MRLANLWFFICAVLLFPLFRLLGDNLLYGAIMFRLKDFGIEERDLIGALAANLLPLIATGVVLVIIYRVTLRIHQARVAAIATAESPPAITVKKGKLGRALSRIEPLPAIALGLAIALVGGVYLQMHYGPLTRLPLIGGTTHQAMSEAEKGERRAALAEILTVLAYMKTRMEYAHELGDNWQYRIQTNGPFDFTGEINILSQQVGEYGRNQLDTEARKFDKFKDISALSRPDFPPITQRTSDLIAEIRRVASHFNNRDEVVFVLVNDTKMAAWRTVLSEVDQWISSRMQAINAKKAEYSE